MEFFVRDAGTYGYFQVNIHAILGNSTWTESTVTWNSVSNFSNTVYASETLGYSYWSTFDVTELALKWKSGELDGQCGLIMVANDESQYITTCSTDYTYSTLWPYVVVTYNPKISIDRDSADVQVNYAIQLYASTIPENMAVTWSSSDDTIASVSGGVVFAYKAGTVTITASVTDENGIVYYDTCTVYVYVSNGVYYIKNLNSNYYLHVKYGGIDNFTDVYQYSKYSDTANNDYRTRQMWKLYYLGNGRYSIRPLSKLDKGLDVTGGNVDIYSIGTSDTLSSVPSYGEWTIDWYLTGYIFKNNGSTSLTMQIEDASTSLGGTVVASTYSTNKNCRWELISVSSPPSGAYLYDTLEEAIVSTSTRAIDVGTTKSLSTLQLSAVAYSGSNISQNFSWYSSNNTIATVDSNGAVTGIAIGKATITGYVYRNGAYYYVSYTICVGFPSLFGSLINNNILVADKLDLTDDGLFLTTTPLSKILQNKGIRYLPTDSDYSTTWDINDYFDDWYLFAVSDGTAVSYGLYKMREQENDYVDSDGDGNYEADNDVPGVTISFVGLDSTKVTTCFILPTDANKYALYQALIQVTGPESHEADDIISSYFSKTSSFGAYLIAEKSVTFFANCVYGNTISVPQNLRSIFEEIEIIDEQLNNIFLDNYSRLILLQNKAYLNRIPNALKAINDAAGKTIFDFDNYTITVQDKNNLTLYEKQAILACFTANVTFNSFAAEVEFHADAVNSWQSNIPWLGDAWYNAAIRADMAIGEEAESGYFDDYYDLDGDLVQTQISEHGEW